MSGIAPDRVLSLFEYYEARVDDLRKNAARIFGLKGYFVPCVTSPRSALIGSARAEAIHFIASGALAANLFYSYYLVTADIKTLRNRIFPFMREVLAFYADFLKLDPGGFYTTVPSYSPSSTPGNIIAGRPLKDFAFAVNSTVDFLAIGGLLDNLIEASKICGEKEDIIMLEDMKTKFPPFSVNDLGCLREYTNSPFIDGAVNCGVMHGYGLWPLKNISFGDISVAYRPRVAHGAVAQKAMISLRRASFNAVVSRLESSGSVQNARILATGAAQAAHAGLGEISAQKVKNILLKLLASCFTAGGLCLGTDWRGGGFTKPGAPEFDVCGNIGFTTAVTECIVQSDSRNLRILPSIFDELCAGRIMGAAADFGARVFVDWDIKKGRCTVKILPKITCKINISVCEKFKYVKNRHPMDSQINGLRDFQLTADKPVVLEFFQSST
jgi:alpha-L-fucosidase 2